MSIEEYIVHLISSPRGNSCVQAGEVLQASHDQVNRLLSNSSFSGRELFEKARPELQLQGGTLTVDDSVIDKPYAKLEANDLVGMYWSGKHHRSVRGVNLVVLVYTDPVGCCLPVNFRLFDPRDDRTKHDLLAEMLRQLIGWGLRPARFTADSWYASVDTMKWLRAQELSFQIGVKSDRLVSTQPGQYQRVEEIEEVGEDGLITHLKKFDFVKLFRTVDSDGDARHYVVYEADRSALEQYDSECFKRVKLQHWNVEKLFRTLKQVCQLERFFVRKAQAVINHVYAALRAFQRLSSWSRNQIYENVYSVQKTIFLQARRQFIKQMTA